MTTVEGIISRIQTFTIQNWDFRYQIISPYLLAQHGFSNCGENEIECTICGQKMRLEDPYKDEEYDKEKAQDYLENLITSLKTNHDDDCLFKSLNELPTIGKDFLFFEGRKIYNDNLRTYTNGENIELPVLDPNFMGYIVKKENSVYPKGEKDLSVLFGKLSSDSPLIAKPSEILSIFGWRYDTSIEESRIMNEEEQHGPKLLCPFCGRKIFINTFPQMKDIVTHFDKDYGREAINPFDVLESHRYFCVWGGVPNQNEDDSLGWNICVELLRYDKFRGKDGNNDKSNFQLSDQNSQEQAHMDLVLEQTQFKQEVLNRINELREFKEKGKKRCEQVLEKIQKIKVKDENTEKFEQKLSQYKVSLEDMIKELNLKVEPVKKVKPDEIVELEPQDS